MSIETTDTLRDLETGDEIRWEGRKTFATVVDPDASLGHKQWVDVVDKWGNEYSFTENHHLLPAKIGTFSGVEVDEIEVRR